MKSFLVLALLFLRVSCQAGLEESGELLQSKPNIIVEGSSSFVDVETDVLGNQAGFVAPVDVDEKFDESHGEIASHRQYSDEHVAVSNSVNQANLDLINSLQLTLQQTSEQLRVQIESHGAVKLENTILSSRIGELESLLASEVLKNSIKPAPEIVTVVTECPVVEPVVCAAVPECPVVEVVICPEIPLCPSCHVCPVVTEPIIPECPVVTQPECPVVTVPECPKVAEPTTILSGDKDIIRCQADLASVTSQLIISQRNASNLALNARVAQNEDASLRLSSERCVLEKGLLQNQLDETVDVLASSKVSAATALTQANEQLAFVQAKLQKATAKKVRVVDSSIDNSASCDAQVCWSTFLSAVQSGSEELIETIEGEIATLQWAINDFIYNQVIPKTRRAIELYLHTLMEIYTRIHNITTTLYNEKVYPFYTTKVVPFVSDLYYNKIIPTVSNVYNTQILPFYNENILKYYNKHAAPTVNLYYNQASKVISKQYNMAMGWYEVNAEEWVEDHILIVPDFIVGRFHLYAYETHKYVTSEHFSLARAQDEVVHWANNLVHKLVTALSAFEPVFLVVGGEKNVSFVVHSILAVVGVMLLFLLRSVVVTLIKVVLAVFFAPILIPYLLVAKVVGLVLNTNSGGNSSAKKSENKKGVKGVNNKENKTKTPPGWTCDGDVCTINSK